MKKFLLFIISLTIFLSAAVVPVDRAKKVAENYYKNYAPLAEKSNAVQKILTKEYMLQPTWYVVQFTKGWVIVAADDAVRPILGYSFDGKISEDLSNMQNPFVNRFSYYDRQIVHNVREKGYVDTKAATDWKDIENDIFLKDSKVIVVDALVETKWGQGWPWNEMCPLDEGQPTLVGSAGTALAQLLRYHRDPWSGSNIKSYTWEGEFSSQDISVDYSKAYYEYDQMPLTADSIDHYNIKELSQLCFDAAVSVDTDFGKSQSSANYSDISSAIKTYFNYGYSDFNYLGTITDETEHSETINLDLGNNPLIWMGADLTGSSWHTFILDGRTDDYWYHFNWGWEGSYDGWFQLTDLTPGENDYSISQYCVHNTFYGMYGGAPVPPERFEINPESTNSVKLTWDLEEPYDEMAYYEIYRNEALHATVPDTVYSFTDKDLPPGDYNYKLRKYHFYQFTYWYSFFTEVISINISSIEDNIPFETTLSQNYPNPFNPETSIRFSIATDTKVRLKIYNTAGQLVAIPVDRFMKRGSYNIGLNASKLSGGVYIYKLEADGKELTKKMTVVK